MKDISDEQRVWADMNEREDKIHKTGLKQGHLKHLHVSKQLLTRHNYGTPTLDPFQEISILGCLPEVAVH